MAQKRSYPLEVRADPITLATAARFYAQNKIPITSRSTLVRQIIDDFAKLLVTQQVVEPILSYDEAQQELINLLGLKDKAVVELLRTKMGNKSLQDMLMSEESPQASLAEKLAQRLEDEE